MLKKGSLLAGLVFFLTGCAGAKVEDYKGRTPTLDLRQYLKGDLEAWGVFRNRFGMVDEQFHIVMKGKWEGNKGTLEEHFTYVSGKKDTRVWHIEFKDDNHFTATAADVTGTAIGAQFGNAANIHYLLQVNFKGSTYDIAMDDWMYLIDDKTLLNHTVMSKFGLKVGELIITFKKK